MRTFALLVLLVLLVTSSIIDGSVSHAADFGEFTPEKGFSGDSEGRGSLEFLFGKPRPFHVQSRGIPQDDGSLRLEQTIIFQGEPPQQRVWHISQSGLHRYTGTLSDAAGPVAGTSNGPRLSLKYRIKSLLFMHQELELMPDGRTMTNVGTLTLLGIPVGRLRETISRKPTRIGADPVEPD